MGGISIWHWLIVLLVIVLIFGTKKLRNIGEDLGSAVKGFKQGMKAGGEDQPPATPDATPAPQVTAKRPADANTVDVEAKTKS